MSEVPAEIMAAAAATPAPAAETPKPKPRSRAKKATAAKGKTAPNPAVGLIAAMKFLSPAQSKTGTVGETFCNICNKWAAASNGVLTIATPIEEDVEACPQWALFLDALNRVSGDMTLTAISSGMLAVTSGDFRGVVPCAPPDQVFISPPDEAAAVIDDRIKQAFEAVLKVPNEQSQQAVKAGILLQANSVVATNGAIIFEYWHGIDLPPNLLIPKAAAQAVVKSGKTLARLGFSQTSVTFWFEDYSFIKTQMFDAQYPEYEGVISCDYSAMWPVPEKFFEAVAAVSQFSENGNVYFKDGQIVSNLSDETPSFYRLDTLPDGEGFNGKYIAMIEGRAERILFGLSRNNVSALFFVGNNLRGCIAGLDKSAPRVYGAESSEGRSTHGADFENNQCTGHPSGCACADCEIPF